VTLSEKAFISILVSIFLMSGIVVTAYTGFFNDNFPAMPNSLKAIVFALAFITLFLFIFFLSNLMRFFSRKKKTASGDPPCVTPRQGGLLAAASHLSSPAGIDETSSHDVIYEKNGVPYIKSGMVNDDKNPGKLDSNFIKLVESVKGFPSAACSVTTG
jgi:hypothetical protein